MGFVQNRGDFESVETLKTYDLSVNEIVRINLRIQRVGQLLDPSELKIEHEEVGRRGGTVEVKRHLRLTIRDGHATNVALRQSRHPHLPAGACVENRDHGAGVLVDTGDAVPTVLRKIGVGHVPRCLEYGLVRAGLEVIRPHLVKLAVLVGSIVKLLAVGRETHHAMRHVALVRCDVLGIGTGASNVPYIKIVVGVGTHLDQCEPSVVVADVGDLPTTRVAKDELFGVSVGGVAVEIEKLGVTFIGGHIERRLVAGESCEGRLDIVARGQVARPAVHFSNEKMIAFVTALIRRVQNSIIERKIADCEYRVRRRVRESSRLATRDRHAVGVEHAARVTAEQNATFVMRERRARHAGGFVKNSRVVCCMALGADAGPRPGRGAARETHETDGDERRQHFGGSAG